MSLRFICEAGEQILLAVSLCVWYTAAFVFVDMLHFSRISQHRYHSRRFPVGRQLRLFDRRAESLISCDAPGRDDKDDKDAFMFSTDSHDRLFKSEQPRYLKMMLNVKIVYV